MDSDLSGTHDNIHLYSILFNVPYCNTGLHVFCLPTFLNVSPVLNVFNVCIIIIEYVILKYNPESNKISLKFQSVYWYTWYIPEFFFI